MVVTTHGKFALERILVKVDWFNKVSEFEFAFRWQSGCSAIRGAAERLFEILGFLSYVLQAAVKNSAISEAYISLSTA